MAASVQKTVAVFTIKYEAHKARLSSSFPHTLHLARVSESLLKGDSHSSLIARFFLQLARFQIGLVASKIM